MARRKQNSRILARFAKLPEAEAGKMLDCPARHCRISWRGCALRQFSNENGGDCIPTDPECTGGRCETGLAVLEAWGMSHPKKTKREAKK